jgi:hypothetical protein
MKNDDEMCKAIANLENNILGAGIIENLSLVAMYSKPGVSLPKEEKFNLMFAQSEIMISIAKSNADFFGRFRYIVSSFEKSDTMFLPSRSEGSGKDRIVVIQVQRPCDHEKITEAVVRLMSMAK